jgi:hypothetical protein
MTMKKLKHILNETQTFQPGKVYSNPFARAFVSEMENDTNDGKLSDEEKKQFLESVKLYREIGDRIGYRGNLTEVHKMLKSIVEMASKLTLDETEDWFDKVTVSRHIKALNEAFKIFSKTVQEMYPLQQRLESAYDEMGEVLSKYYEINSQEPKLTKENKSMKLTQLIEQEKEYKEFFKSALKKFGVSSPADLDTEKKKEFFTYVDNNWKAKNETVTESNKFAGWVAIFNGKKIEIDKSEAKDLWGAKQIAIKRLNVPKSKQGLLAIKPGYNESVNENKSKFNVDDLVYNKRTKTVGIVRIGEERGEVKTDADGNVNADELEKFNPIKHKHHQKAKVAPSTEREINSRGLFNPFKSESVNEIKKGTVILPYAMDRYGEFVVDKVYKNEKGETSYSGKFVKSGERRDFILNKKDKIIKENKSTKLMDLLSEGFGIGELPSSKLMKMKQPVSEILGLKESKADILRNNMPGYVGVKFAKKASDEDLLKMSDLKDELARAHNQKKDTANIEKEIAKLQKKYGIRESIKESKDPMYDLAAQVYDLVDYKDLKNKSKIKSALAKLGRPTDPLTIGMVMRKMQDVIGEGIKESKAETINESVRISLFDPNKNKIIKTLSVDRTYREAEAEVETLNKRLSNTEKDKGFYWKVTAINEATIKKFDNVHIKSKNLSGIVFDISGKIAVVNTGRHGLVKVNINDLTKIDNVNESKKTFKVNPQIGKAKYSINFYDGKKTHKDGSPFHDLKIFKNKEELDVAIKDFKSKGYVQESINEAKKYDIGMGSLGNGITVYNRAEEVRGDYKKIAHISDEGDITYYDKNLPSNIKKQIEDRAKSMKTESVDMKLKNLIKK